MRASTELGVKTIIPVISHRTLLKPSPNKLSRWQKIAQEATEQSERQIIPTIAQPNQYKKIMENMTISPGEGYIAVTRQKIPHLLTCLTTQNKNKIIIVTGPEGGWIEDEITMAVNKGFQPVSLGKRILRAVTAPIFALSLAVGVTEK